MKRRIIRDNEKLYTELFQELQDAMESNVREMFLMYLGEIGNGLVNSSGLQPHYADGSKTKIDKFQSDAKGVVYVDGERVEFPRDNERLASERVRNIAGKDYYKETESVTVPGDTYTVHVAPVDVVTQDTAKAEQGYTLLVTPEEHRGSVVPVARVGKGAFQAPEAQPDLISQVILPDEKLQGFDSKAVEGKTKDDLLYVKTGDLHFGKYNRYSITNKSFACKKLIFANEKSFISWFEHKHLNTAEDPSLKLCEASFSTLSTDNFKESSVPVEGKSVKIVKNEIVVAPTVTKTLSDNVQRKLVFVFPQKVFLTCYARTMTTSDRSLVVKNTAEGVEIPYYVYEIVLE